YNEYGPTEATVWSSVYACDPHDPHRRVPIGRAIASARLYVLDSAGEPVPSGVPGELVIGGAALARGYLGRPAATADAFRPDPFSPVPGARRYQSGDLVQHDTT